jgi:hypothetical protein
MHIFIVRDSMPKREGVLLRAVILLIWKPLLVEYMLSIITSLLIFSGPFFIHATLTAIDSPQAKPLDILGKSPTLFILF